MRIPPPLQLFALGALYHKIGNYEASVEYLSRVEQPDFTEEHRIAPSPQLRRYVSMLRELEQDPSISPLVLGAIRNLERNRKRNSARLLAESRGCVEHDHKLPQNGNLAKANDEQSERRSSGRRSSADYRSLAGRLSRGRGVRDLIERYLKFKGPQFV